MTALEDGFWDAAITEAATRRGPPDQTQQVMLRLQNPELDGKPARRVPWLRRGLEVAAAAVVLLAIGVLTGLIPLGKDNPVEDPLQVPREVAAAPGAEYAYTDGVLELRSGWLLVSTGAPDVRSGASILSDVDGRVLIHAAGVPTRGQAEAVTGWLQANRLEFEMISDIKLWARGTVLAALVLSGSAMLDGQKIEGPKPEVTATAEWHVVRSVMDIDNLPKGVRFVNADGLSAAHLDFLSEVKSLEGISLRGGDDLRVEQLQGLKSLPKLTWLDLRGAGWAQVPDLVALNELPALKRLGIDLIPAAYGRSSDKYGVYKEGSLYKAYKEGRIAKEVGVVVFSSFNYVEYVLPTLKALSDSGVEIELGQWQPTDEAALASVLADLPTVSGIVLFSPSVSMMKVLASHEKLRSLELVEYRAGQIGLAYLARKTTIDDVSISATELSLEEAYQISRMGLRFLRIDAKLSGSPEQSFEALARMKNLRELELVNMDLNDSGVAALVQFKSMQRLDRLRIEGYAPEVEFMAAHVVPTRRLEIRRRDGYLSIPNKSDVPDFLLKGEAGIHLEEIRFEVVSAESNLDYLDDECLASLKSYPNLKRVEVQRGGFNEPAVQDTFANWLKSNLPGVEVVITP